MSDIKTANLGHINLRGNAADNQFTDAVAETLGHELPLAANTLSLSAHRIYWLGPDEWQIVTDLENSQSVIAELSDCLKGQHVSLNNLSGGQVAYHLSGTHVPELLSKGCTLDLDPAIFRIGDCAQSSIGKSSMLLGNIDKAPVYELIVRRSFSEYVQRWLHQNENCLADSASC